MNSARRTYWNIEIQISRYRCCCDTRNLCEKCHTQFAFICTVMTRILFIRSRLFWRRFKGEPHTTRCLEQGILNSPDTSEKDNKFASSRSLRRYGKRYHPHTRSHYSEKQSNNGDSCQRWLLYYFSLFYFKKGSWSLCFIETFKTGFKPIAIKLQFATVNVV